MQRDSLEVRRARQHSGTLEARHAMQLGALPIWQIEPKTCLLASGENRLQWRPTIDHWSGATESIGKHDVGRDTECPIERGGKIFGGDGVIFWISALAIGAAVGRSSLNACAGE